VFFVLIALVSIRKTWQSCWVRIRRRYHSNKIKSIFESYRLSVTRVPVSFLQRLNADSSRSGSSFRNFSSRTTFSISELSRPFIPSCKLGNRTFRSATVLLESKIILQNYSVSLPSHLILNVVCSIPNFLSSTKRRRLTRKLFVKFYRRKQTTRWRSAQVRSNARVAYLDLLNIKAMFSTSDILTRVFLLITLPRSSSTVLSSSLKFANVSFTFLCCNVFFSVVSREIAILTWDLFPALSPPACRDLPRGSVESSPYLRLSKLRPLPIITWPYDDNHLNQSLNANFLY